MSSHPALPIWARPEAFPVQPKIGNFGFQGDDGEPRSFESFSLLEDACLAEEKFPLLVWTPASEYLVVAEECEGLREAFLTVSRERMGRRVANIRKLSILFGLVVLGQLVYGFLSESPFIDTLQSSYLLLIVIPWVFYGLLPWYSGAKYLRQSMHPDAEYWEKEVADARFEYWLKHQKAPMTLLISAVMIGIGAIQLIKSGGFDWSHHAVETVALTKGGGDPFWRYMTGPLAHGNLIHWVMNFGALRYLAKRMEVLVGWQHMLWVLAFSAYAGAVATVNFMPSIPSVGISGGLLGILGFLIGFETRHKNLVPKSPRRRLALALVSVTVLGILGFQFIDNAAHAGGLLAGIFYGVVVFPSSTSVQSPGILKRDYAVGTVALLVLLISFALCAYHLIG